MLENKGIVHKNIGKCRLLSKIPWEHKFHLWSFSKDTLIINHQKGATHLTPSINSKTCSEGPKMVLHALWKDRFSDQPGCLMTSRRYSFCCRFFGPNPIAIKLMVVIKLQTVYQSIKWVVKRSLDGGSDCPPGNGHSHKDILTTSVFQHNLNVMGVLSRVASQLLKFWFKKPIETGIEDAAKQRKLLLL